MLLSLVRKDLAGVEAASGQKAARQRGSDQRQHLVPRVRPPRRAAKVEVMVDEFPQAQALGEGGPQEQVGSVVVSIVCS